jgi:hypothetical protein
VTSPIWWRWSLAALLTTTSKSPSRPASSAIVACSAGMSVMSQWRNSGADCPGFSCAARRATSASLASTTMSTKATAAPCSTKAATIASPIPLPPPVTNTRLPSRLAYLAKLFISSPCSYTL